MRVLATLGCLAIITAMGSAQTPAKSDFATSPPGKAVVEGPIISVTVLPAPSADPPASMPRYTPEGLVKMSEGDLIDIYKQGIVTPVPNGYTPGLVIMRPGSLITSPMSKIMKATAWQGKYIPGDGTMVNRQFGVPSIKAAIMDGESWIDGKPTLVFDYEGTSIICGRYRDEIREVCPGVYLGCMHKRQKNGCPKIATWFALDNRCGKSCCLPCKK
jgi:hypothetical protein